jgi:hypothetical protein
MTATRACKRISSLFHILVVTIVLFSLPGWTLGRVSAAPIQCYVKAGAAGANTGDSWTDAFTELQSALGASACTEVWVAMGTYKPTSGTDRAATFRLKGDVALYGGFYGTETQREQRSPAHNLTVLSGDIDNNDSQVPVIFDLTTVIGNTSNSYQVLNGVDGATLDGFTITGGYANESGTYDSGGGMYNMYACPRLANLTFSGNHAIDGGGLYVYGNNPETSPVLTNVTFKANTADHYGGGMHLTNQFTGIPSLADVTFKDNSAGEWGGGLYNNGSNPTLTDVTFSGNHAYDGGGMYTVTGNPILAEVTFSGNAVTGYGGGLFNHYGNPALTYVTFNGNSAAGDGYGGGMYNDSGSPALANVTFNANTAIYGGGMYSRGGTPSLTAVFFSNNAAEYTGGGMSNYESSPTVITAIFSGNTAVQFGGGMYNNTSSPALTDVTFSGNSADNTGGGMYSYSGSPKLEKVTFRNNSASTSGGGMAYYSSTGSTLTNATFSGNSANWGGGIFTSASDPVLNYVTLSGNSALSGGGIYIMSSIPVIRNTILWGNTAPLAGMQVFNDTGASSTLEDSVVQGDCPTGSTCTNIITADPLLGTLGEYGGFTETIPLLAGSSAIDAGNGAACPASDQRGAVRPQGSGCDIGAYEYGVSFATISGNAGTAYVTLTYDGGTFTSSWLGDYKFSVPNFWSGTVTPSKAGYTFDPEAREYTDLTANMSAQDYTAAAITPFLIFLPLVIR